MTRAYHNVTSEFNVKFNAGESFKEGVRKAEAYPAPDYNELLPVFVFSYDDIAKQVTSEMDRTIDKCTKLITQHSITVKPKRPKGRMTQKDREFYNQREFNSVVDEAYLLSGKASLYLQKYEQAITLFEYALLEFSKASAIPEIKLWLAVAYTNTGELDRVEKLLSEANESNQLSKANRANLHAAYANYYLKSGNNGEASKELETALKDESRKANRIRYRFILAYLYNNLNKPAEATAHLQKIISASTDYEQEFSAQMLLAGSFEPSQAQKMKNNLLKMLKNPRNEMYADRIYFALAKTEQIAGNDSAAVAYLEQSVKAESSNPRQNGLSYEMLGNYYYDHEHYAQAYDNLSRATEILDPGFSRYNQIKDRALSIKNVAINWKIIHREDSLQRIAKMPTAEREKMIAEAIAGVIEEERRIAEEEQQRQFHINQQEQQRYSDNFNNSGKWYFYNINSVNAGQAAFTMRWGKRRLEDDWRRKDRSETNVLSNDQEANAGDTIKTTPPPSNKTREFYTRDLPLTPEAMKASNDRIRPALFLLGEAYMNDVKKPLKAIDTFLDLLQRFPDNENLASTYYYLYNLYTEAGNAEEGNKYKQLLIGKYPKAPLTQMITNPNYLQEQRVLSEQIETAYAEALKAYNERRYSEAWAMAGRINEQYPQNLIQPQIALLRAFCTAKTSNIGTYKQALTDITAQYPTSEAAQKAKELLTALNANALQYTTSQSGTAAGTTAGATSDMGSTYTAPTKVAFTPDDDGVHYFAILFDSKQNANELLFAMESYNIDHFLDHNYEVSVHAIADNYSMVSVKPFANRQRAEDYALSIEENKALEAFGPINFRRMLITPANLELLTQTKAVVDYLDFFNTHYAD